MKRLSKQTAVVAGALLAAAALAIAIPRLTSTHGLSAAELKQADLARAAGGTLEQRFALLSRRHTNKCSLASADLDAIAVRGRLQGSCCSPMDFGRYARQVRSLKRYAAVADIPADPYDLQVTLAKRLIAYDHSIILSRKEQTIYDRAVKVSHEHGPCCCHCWRWTAFEGQAKELIARERYTATQIATVWGLENGCGGAA